MTHDLREAYNKKFPGKRADKIKFVGESLNLTLWPDEKMRSIFMDGDCPEVKVNSVRIAYRVEQSGRPYSDLVVEINQRRRGYLDPSVQTVVDTGLRPAENEDFIFRGGVTMLVDTETGRVRYAITKSVASNRRLAIQRRYLAQPEASMAYTYFQNQRINSLNIAGGGREIFAMLHGNESLEEIL